MSNQIEKSNYNYQEKFNLIPVVKSNTRMLFSSLMRQLRYLTKAKSGSVHKWATESIAKFEKSEERILKMIDEAADKRCGFSKALGIRVNRGTDGDYVYCKWYSAPYDYEEERKEGVDLELKLADATFYSLFAELHHRIQSAVEYMSLPGKCNCDFDFILVDAKEKKGRLDAELKFYNRFHETYNEKMVTEVDAAYVQLEEAKAEKQKRYEQNQPKMNLAPKEEMVVEDVDLSKVTVKLSDVVKRKKTTPKKKFVNIDSGSAVDDLNADPIPKPVEAHKEKPSDAVQFAPSADFKSDDMVKVTVLENTKNGPVLKEIMITREQYEKVQKV